MPTLSLLTPVHSASVAYLPEAYASLTSQVLPTGWTWEWCIQEDGAGVQARAVLPDDPRIQISASRTGGPGVARTMAFARSSGDVVRVLDADDQLTPGALSRDLTVLNTHSTVGWVTSAVTDLLPDGTTRGFELGDPADGELPRGSAAEFWMQHGRPPVHPATLCARRHLIALMGGWMALPASEDTGLLLALDAVSRGWFTAQTGLLYRKHPGQMTAHPAHISGEEREARMALIAERVSALTLDVPPLYET